MISAREAGQAATVIRLVLGTVEKGRLLLFLWTINFVISPGSIVLR